jgi:uncharacterized damage-inducible protein DinB
MIAASFPSAQERLAMKPIPVVVLLALAVLAPPAARAAEPAAAPDAQSNVLRFLQEYNRKNIVAAAERMAEADYGFQPTPALRTFGQLVAHVADVQYLLCSAVKGEANPAAGERSIEKTKTRKADLLAALRASFEYCAGAYAGMTDAGLGRTPAGAESTNAHSLTLNVYHAGQHYGHMTTYLRLKGLVPPSSQGGG